MTIELDCPRCNRSLSLPDEVAGQYAFCKHCEGRIWVATESSNAASDSSPESPPPSPTDAQRDSQKPPPIASHTASSQADPSPGPPPTTSPRLENTTKMPDAPPQAQTGPDPENAAESITPPPSNPPGKQKKRRIAKLITAEPAQSRLEPEPDGHLPELALTASDEDDAGEKQKKSSNDWLVLAVIIISLIASTAMLMLDTESSQSSADKTQQSIHGKIRAKYFGPDQGPWPRYQQYLRDAALARSQGNFTKEEMYYRKVLHLLNAQHLDKTDQGVTGLRRKTRNDPSLPSDEELIELLHTLLNNSQP